MAAPYRYQTQAHPLPGQRLPDSQSEEAAANLPPVAQLQEQVVERVRDTIVRQPALAIGVAAATGLILGWWYKR